MDIQYYILVNKTGLFYYEYRFGKRSGYPGDSGEFLPVSNN